VPVPPVDLLIVFKNCLGHYIHLYDCYVTPFLRFKGYCQMTCIRKNLSRKRLQYFNLILGEKGCEDCATGTVSGMHKPNHRDGTTASF